MEIRTLKSKALESKELETKDLENVSGGNGYPYYPGMPQPIPVYVPVRDPNMPMNPNMPPIYPVSKKVIGYHTYCPACTRTDVVYLGPNAQIIGSFICTCGTEMLDDGEIYE